MERGFVFLLPDDIQTGEIETQAFGYVDAMDTLVLGIALVAGALAMAEKHMGMNPEVVERLGGDACETIGQAYREQTGK